MYVCMYVCASRWSDIPAMAVFSSPTKDVRESRDNTPGTSHTNTYIQIHTYIHALSEDSIVSYQYLHTF